MAASCLPANLTNYTSEVLNCCTWLIKDDNANTIFVLDLANVLALHIVPSNKVKIKDRATSLSITTDQLLQLGYTVDTLNQLAADCRCSVGGGGTTTLNGVGVSMIQACRIADDKTVFIEVCKQNGATIYTDKDSGAVVTGTFSTDYQPCDNDSSSIVTLCKCDDVNGDGTLIRNYTEVYSRSLNAGVVSSILSGIFTDKTLTTAYTPTNPIECEDIGTEVIDNIRQCMLDDVNGDGTTLVPYVRYVALMIDGTTAIIANYTSTFTGTYVPTNPIDPNSVGIPANGKTGRTIITNGDTWSPTQLVKSYTIRVSGASTGSTFLDSYGNTTILEDDEVSSWDFSGLESDGVPTVTAGNPASIVITYSSI